MEVMAIKIEIEKAKYSPPRMEFHLKRIKILGPCSNVCPKEISMHHNSFILNYAQWQHN